MSSGRIVILHKAHQHYIFGSLLSGKYGKSCQLQPVFGKTAGCQYVIETCRVQPVVENHKVSLPKHVLAIQSSVEDERAADIAKATGPLQVVHKMLEIFFCCIVVRDSSIAPFSSSNLFCRDLKSSFAASLR